MNDSIETLTQTENTPNVYYDIYNQNYYRFRNDTFCLKISELLPTKNYYFNQSIDSKFILLKSLLNHNLIGFSSKDIIQNIYNFNFLNIDVDSVYKKISRYTKPKNIYHTSFEDLNKSLEFLVYLNQLSIKCFYFPHLGKHIISSETEISTYLDQIEPETIKKYVIQKIKEKCQTDKLNKKDQEYNDLHEKFIRDYSFENHTLEELLNSYPDKGFVIFESCDYFNSYTKTPIPLEYFEKKGTFIYNLEPDEYGILKGFNPKKINFRKNIFVKSNVDFKVINRSNYQKILICHYDNHSITLTSNFQSDKDKNEIITFLKKIWRKGYIFSTTGILLYSSGKKVPHTEIKSPFFFNFDYKYLNYLIEF